jgi:CheY-like chemotaxis protein
MVPATRSVRVLLAEDNYCNRRLVTRLLEKRGHTVEGVETGREALAALESSQFDLVLMDLQMPIMGGLDATAVIRDREKATGTHLPIFALTAMDGERDLCLAAGMDGYLTKPFNFTEVIRTIETVRGVASLV